MMVLTEQDLDRAETSILSLLQNADAPVPPEEVIKTLRSQNYSEFLLRAAIWILIDHQRIEFTKFRLLRIPDSTKSISEQQISNGR
jgi:hypothetical protein